MNNQEYNYADYDIDLPDYNQEERRIIRCLFQKFPHDSNRRSIKNIMGELREANKIIGELKEKYSDVSEKERQQLHKVVAYMSRYFGNMSLFVDEQGCLPQSLDELEHIVDEKLRQVAEFEALLNSENENSN